MSFYTLFFVFSYELDLVFDWWISYVRVNLLFLKVLDWESCLSLFSWGHGFFTVSKHQWRSS